MEMTGSLKTSSKTGSSKISRRYVSKLIVCVCMHLCVYMFICLNVLIHIIYSLLVVTIHSRLDRSVELASSSGPSQLFGELGDEASVELPVNVFW